MCPAADNPASSEIHTVICYVKNVSAAEIHRELCMVHSQNTSMSEGTAR
jgi:hypothetical protein